MAGPFDQKFSRQDVSPRTAAEFQLGARRRLAQELGIPFDVEAQDLQPGLFGQAANFILGQRLGIHPFQDEPVPDLPGFDPANPTPEQEAILMSMHPMERMLAVTTSQDAMSRVMSAPEHVFEAYFGKDPADLAERALKENEPELFRQMIRGPASPRLSRHFGTDDEGLQAILKDMELQQLMDRLIATGTEEGQELSLAATLATPGASVLSQIPGFVPPSELIAGSRARLKHMATIDKLTLRETRAKTRKAETEASVAEALEEQEKLGDLSYWYHPNGTIRGVFMGQTEEVNRAREDGFRILGLASSMSLTSMLDPDKFTAADTDDPSDTFQDAKEQALRVSGVRATVGAMLADLNDNLGLMGVRSAMILGEEEAPTGRLGAYLADLNPKFMNELSNWLLGASREELQDFRTRIGTLEFFLVPEATQETSRFSDSERRMVAQTYGAIRGGGTDGQAMRVRLQNVQDLLTVSENKAQIIMAREIGDEEALAKLNPLIPANQEKLNALMEVAGLSQGRAQRLMGHLISQWVQIQNIPTDELGAKVGASPWKADAKVRLEGMEAEEDNE